VPELDAEQEVDVGRYWCALQARWWLPLVGLVVGALLGYLAAVGGGEVYKAETTLYLGQPFSPTGNAPVQGLGTNPTIVSQIARSERSLKAAAAKCGTRVGQLRGKVSTQTVTASGARGRVTPGQNPLVELTVQANRARVAECAADTLSDSVVDRVSSYVDVKIGSLNRRLEVLNDQLESLGRKIAAQDSALTQQGLSPLEKLVLVSQTENAEQRRGIVEEERQEVTQQLALAQEVERARVVEQAGAVKTTARSPQNSAVVGGIIGLLLGGIAAVAWPAVAARRRVA
jgi:hypothetical protein